MRIILSSGLYAGKLLSQLEKSKEFLPSMFLNYSCIYRTGLSLPYRLYPVRVFIIKIT
jgi:hypothetical protein